jgi:nucleoid DNA-binding protein
VGVLKSEALGVSHYVIMRRGWEGINPRTGESVALQQKHSIHFKVGLELRQRVLDSASEYKISD